MPSPFPGMDPFVESQKWSGFHVQFMTELTGMLVPQVRPRYEVDPERRIYVERHLEDPQIIIPDVTLSAPYDSLPESGQAESGFEAELAPIVVTLPMPEEQHETLLSIRDLATHEVVTVIELLSPGNKRPASDGRKEYLEKRVAVLQSRTNLVEIDLLRGGLRLPTVEPLEAADYYVFISRRCQRPKATVQPWMLRRRMPTIPIPLANGDADASLDLQAAFNAVYDRAGYDYALNYSRALSPALSDQDAAWVAKILPGRRT